MKNNWIKILSLVLLVFSAGLMTSTYAAVALPESMEYQDTKLTLNGHGSRVKMFMKVYENSLYLLSSSSNAEEIINKDETMAIRIDVTSIRIAIASSLLIISSALLLEDRRYRLFS